MRWPVRLLIGGAAALLVACALLGTALARPAAREHRAALARWSARPFGDYRLAAQDELCTYEVLVRRGRVNSSFRDSCQFRARPIDALFRVIERDGEVTASCGARGCLCETLTHVWASYHPRLGYPTEIVVAVEIRPRWLSPDFWRALFAAGSPPSCSGANRRTISVLAVEPLHR
jgi:hypothetical protein